MFSGHRHFLYVPESLVGPQQDAYDRPGREGILYVYRSTWLYAIRQRVESVAFFPLWEGEESLEHFLSVNIKALSFYWLLQSGRALKDSFKKENNRVFQSPAG